MEAIWHGLNLRNKRTLEHWNFTSHDDMMSLCLLNCVAQEQDRKRHLLRLWVAPPVERPLPQCYAELYGSVRVGDRGGIRVKGYEEKIPLEAE